MNIEEITEEARQQIEVEFKAFCVTEAKCRLEEIEAAQARLTYIRKEFATDMQEEKLRKRFNSRNGARYK